jgi:hypothetical protein
MSEEQGFNHFIFSRRLRNHRLEEIGRGQQQEVTRVISSFELEIVDSLRRDLDRAYSIGYDDGFAAGAVLNTMTRATVHELGWTGACLHHRIRDLLVLGSKDHA